MHHSANSVNRRAVVVRSLGLVSAAAGTLLGADHREIRAEKKQKKKLSKIQIAQKAQAFADDCVLLGGTPETTSKPGGVTVSCTSSSGGGDTCTFYSKGVRCHASTVGPGSLPDLQSSNPATTPSDVQTIPPGTITAARSSSRRHKK